MPARPQPFCTSGYLDQGLCSSNRFVRAPAREASGAPEAHAKGAHSERAPGPLAPAHTPAFAAAAGRDRFGLVHTAFAAALGFAVFLSTGGPATAEDLLEALFGKLGRAAGLGPAEPSEMSPETSPPERTPGASEPGSDTRQRSVAFCVRLCDGRYFPMYRQTGVNPAQLCTALCPASPTKVFWGNEISRAVAGDGARYANTENALVYRKRLVPGCTCNGTNFGLAPIAAGQDPTVRPGDIQMTGSKR
jgi:hypothetical protein